MSNPLIRKLSIVHDFTDEDRATLTRICSRSRLIPAGRDIIGQGDRPDDVHLVLSGFAQRYKLTPDGARQIVAVLVPGDFCDLHIAILGRMDHAIATVTPCTVVDVPVATIHELTERHPRVTRALWWATLVDEGVLREWLLNMGRRDAAQRLAHFLCEMLLRLRWVGLAEEGAYSLPFTQPDLGDILGMTHVHVNRTLKNLREAGLVASDHRRVSIPNVGRLMAFCDFDPTYLHARAREAEPSGG